MRLLVTGREGQVARSLAALSGETAKVVTLGRPDLDITDPESIARAIDREQPDILVNAAAYTAVDKAESDAEAAFVVNRDGAGNVAAAAARAAVPVIHISTDYVFAGDKPSPYLESDATGPMSVYGNSKLAGEKAVAHANPRHVILRTAWIYSSWGSNFARTMLRLAQTRDTIRVVADQKGTPTYAPDIAEGICAVARTVLADPDGEAWRGIFHMTAEGYTTWAGFAEAVFVASAAAGGPSAKVEHIATAEYPTPAPRPANSQLESGKFRNVFGHQLPEWEVGVRRWEAAYRWILHVN